MNRHFRSDPYSRLAFPSRPHPKDKLTVIFLSKFQGLPIEEVAARLYLSARAVRPRCA